MQQRRQTIVLDEETLSEVEAARERLSSGSIKPSKAAVVREAVKRGLPSLGREAPAPSSGRAA